MSSTAATVREFKAGVSAFKRNHERANKLDEKQRECPNTTNPQSKTKGKGKGIKGGRGNKPS
eukprot:6750700-Prorocentrum_lima.AAC.1